MLDISSMPVNILVSENANYLILLNNNNELFIDIIIMELREKIN